jgi:hypothetical protein
MSRVIEWNETAAIAARVVYRLPWLDVVFLSIAGLGLVVSYITWRLTKGEVER